MTRPVAVLRPEPGNAATAARVERAGLTAIRLPLFTVAPLAWTPPDPRDHDALLLTSANAVRHAGEALASLRALPVLAVGAATAAAARAAGFAVVAAGEGAVGALLDRNQSYRRILHLAGRHRTAGTADLVTRAVYASEPAAVSFSAIKAIAGSIALVHSARAASRLTEVVDPADRASILVVVPSSAVAEAIGPGWARVAIADHPTDIAIIACARALAD